MAITNLQIQGSTSGGLQDLVSKAFDSNVTAGSLLVAGVVTNSVAPGATDVSDTLTGTTWAQDVVSAGGFYVSIYSIVAPSGGACTVTFNPTGSDFCCISISEYAAGSGRQWNATAANRLDGTPTAAHGNDLNPDAGGITTSGENVVVGVVTQNEGAATITPNIFFTQIFESENTSGDMPINGEYKITASSGTEHAAWTLSATRLWAAAGVAYKTEAASGGGGIAHLWTTKGWIF